MIARLDAGEPPLDVLGTEPELPQLQDVKWVDVAEVFLQLGNGRTRAEVAIRWFGGALMALATQRDLEAGERPWKDAFDRAESRTSEPRAPRALFNDWLADEIWGLGWLTVWPFDVARRDWTVCLMLLDILTRSLVEAGHRPDRAAAEALMIVELSSTLVEWGATVRALRPRDP